jgi:RNA polymerase sigma factor (sigma-70 family)
MRADSDTIGPEELMEHADWVRGLARSLVGNPHDAEDVVQDTWLAALRAPPGEKRNPRAWLGRVISNFARQRGRMANRSSLLKEVARTQRATAASPEELTQQVETQRDIATLVLELDEPFRQTVLLRYYEGLSSPEIARRMDVPAGTVRWRLSRALGSLRERLDGEYGDRSAWSLLLAPLVEPTATSFQGALAMHTGWKVTVATLTALLLLVFTPLGPMVVNLFAEPELPEVEGMEVVRPTERPPVTPAIAEEPDIRRARTTLEKPNSAEPVEMPWKARIRGQLVVVDQAIPDAVVILRIPRVGLEEQVVPAANGTFETDLEGTGPVRLEVTQRGREVTPPIELTKLISRGLREGGSEERVLVDVGDVLIGAPLSLFVVAIEEASGLPFYPYSAWLVTEFQVEGARGIGHASRSWHKSAFSVGRIEPMLLGEHDSPGALSVVVPEIACGSRLVVLGSKSWGSVRLGEHESLRPGLEIVVPVQPWTEYEFTVLADTTPVEGARVMLLRSPLLAILEEMSDSQRAGIPGAVSAISNDDGLARIVTAPMEGNHIYVVAKHEEHGGVTTLLRTNSKGRQTLRLSPRSISTGHRLRFVDAEGTLIGDVSCVVDGLECPASPDGWHVVPADAALRFPLNVEADHPGFVATRQSIRDSLSAETSITLEVSAPLRVTVTDEVGAAVGGAEVRLIVDSHLKPSRTIETTGSDGIAIFDDTPVDGARRLAVIPPAPQLGWKLPGESNPALSYIPLGERGARIDLERENTPAHSIRVIAVDRDTGATLPIQRLRFRPLPIGGAATRKKHPFGILLGNQNSTVERILAGDYVLWVKCVGGQLGVTPVQVHGDDRDIRCVVGESLALEGHVEVVGAVIPADEILVGALLAGLDLDANTSPDRRVWSSLERGRCDAAGNFRLEGLMPARYELRCLRPISGAEAVEVDLTVDTPESVELTWSSGSCIVLRAPALTSPNPVRIRIHDSGLEEGRWREQILSPAEPSSADQSILLHVLPGEVTVVVATRDEERQWVETARRTIQVAESEVVEVNL